MAREREGIISGPRCPRDCPGRGNPSRHTANAVELNGKRYPGRGREHNAIFCIFGNPRPTIADTGLGPTVLVIRQPRLPGNWTVNLEIE